MGASATTPAERSSVLSKRLAPACDVVRVCVPEAVGEDDREPVWVRVPEALGLWLCVCEGVPEVDEV